LKGDFGGALRRIHLAADREPVVATGAGPAVAITGRAGRRPNWASRLAPRRSGAAAVATSASRACVAGSASSTSSRRTSLGPCVDRELMRALGRLAQIGQDDLLAQLADGLGQRALGVEVIIGGPRRASYGASDSLRHNISNHLIKKTNILAQ